MIEQEKKHTASIAPAPPPKPPIVRKGWWSRLTGETKLGLVVAGSFLALTGGVVGMKQLVKSPAASDNSKEVLQVRIPDIEKPQPTSKPLPPRVERQPEELPPVVSGVKFTPAPSPDVVQVRVDTPMIPPAPEDPPVIKTTKIEDPVFLPPADAPVITPRKDAPVIAPPPEDFVPPVKAPMKDIFKKDVAKIDPLDLPPPVDPLKIKIDPVEIKAPVVDPLKIDPVEIKPPTADPLKIKIEPVEIKPPVVDPLKIKIDPVEIKPPVVDPLKIEPVEIKPPVVDPMKIKITPVEIKPVVTDPLKIEPFEIKPPVADPMKIKIDPVDVKPTTIELKTPVSPATSAKKDGEYDEDMHSIKPNETYRAISKQYFNSEAYAIALQRYNRDNPGQADYVRIPPIWVLEKKYPNDVTASTTRPVGYNPPPVADVTPRNDPVYTVADNGEMLADIAKKSLGSEDAWKRIWDLNPQLNPAKTVPGGTRLRMPGQ